MSTRDRGRAAGTPVADDSLSVSDVILPAQESGLDEVRALLGEEGLIPAAAASEDPDLGSEQGDGVAPADHRRDRPGRVLL